MRQDHHTILFDIQIMSRICRKPGEDGKGQPSQNVSEEEAILRFEAVWLPCC